MRSTKTVILGAGGRDFHNFNLLYRDSPDHDVVAFVFTQIPRQAGRVYPPELSGSLYPQGIPIVDVTGLQKVIEEENVEEVILSLSDLTYNAVMQMETMILGYGADVKIVHPEKTMLQSSKPVIAICGVRTGVGKSTVTRYVVRTLLSVGVNPVVVRHPMAYGEVKKKEVLRFDDPDQLDTKDDLSIEEKGEYLSLVKAGITVYSGVDYEKVLQQAEADADIVIWDGGNNDIPFVKPDLHITVADGTRPGQEKESYPGALNVMLSDIVVINKADAASQDALRTISDNVRAANPTAKVLMADMPLTVDDPSLISGKKVLAVEDGPLLTHGGKSYAAAFLASVKYGAREIVDPRPYAVGLVEEIFEKYPDLGNVLPAVGYDKKQIEDLFDTVKRVQCDSIAYDTITGIGKELSKIRPAVEVTYELQEREGEALKEALLDFVASRGFRPRL